jgi:hypothetical protein
MSVTAASSDGMRQRAKWMAPKDDPILEVLRDVGNLTPFALSREGRVPRVDIGKQWASDRCRDLWKHGLVVMIEDGLYAISEDGIAYLDEELDAATLNELDEGPIADE